MGINISSAINAFVKATIRENGMPFALKVLEDPYIFKDEKLIIVQCGTHYQQ